MQRGLALNLGLLRAARAGDKARAVQALRDGAQVALRPKIALRFFPCPGAGVPPAAVTRRALGRCTRATRTAPPPSPLPLVLSGHAASLTPY